MSRSWPVWPHTHWAGAPCGRVLHTRLWRAPVHGISVVVVIIVVVADGAHIRLGRSVHSGSQRQTAAWSCAPAMPLSACRARPLAALLFVVVQCARLLDVPWMHACPNRVAAERRAPPPGSLYAPLARCASAAPPHSLPAARQQAPPASPPRNECAYDGRACSCGRGNLVPGWLGRPRPPRAPLHVCVCARACACLSKAGPLLSAGAWPPGGTPLCLVRLGPRGRQGGPLPVER